MVSTHRLNLSCPAGGSYHVLSSLHEWLPYLQSISLPNLWNCQQKLWSAPSVCKAKHFQVIRTDWWWFITENNIQKSSLKSKDVWNHRQHYWIGSKVFLLVVTSHAEHIVLVIHISWYIRPSMLTHSNNTKSNFPPNQVELPEGNLTSPIIAPCGDKSWFAPQISWAVEIQKKHRPGNPRQFQVNHILQFLGNCLKTLCRRVFKHEVQTSLSYLPNIFIHPWLN